MDHFTIQGKPGKQVQNLGMTLFDQLGPGQNTAPRLSPLL
jgi:hypothetical protein